MKSALRITTLVSMIFVSLSTSAHASDCDSFDLTGGYAYGWMSSNNDVIHISQKGCEVTVYDTFDKVTWKLDLTGNTETLVPAKIIAANKDSELAHRAMQSMRIRVKAGKSVGGAHVVSFLATQNLPRVADTSLHKGNRVDVDIELSGEMYISGSSSSADNSTLDQVYGFEVMKSKLRLKRINGLTLVNPVKDAFISGANYVLEWGDNTYRNSLSFLNLRRVK